MELIDFAIADNANRVIVIPPKSFFGYEAAVLMKTIREFRRNLARAGVLDIEFPGKDIRVVVAHPLELEDETNGCKLDDGAMVLIAGYNSDIGDLKFCAAVETFYIFPNSPDTRCDGNVIHIGADPFIKTLSEILDIPGNGCVYHDGRVVDQRLLDEYITPFSKRMTNWIANCTSAEKLRLENIHFDGGWYNCPMPAKELFGYVAFAHLAWPDLNMINVRAKSLADMSVGSDVFLRINAAAQMARDHYANIIREHNIDLPEVYDVITVS